PQTWNRYAYTRNNPLLRIDPTGLYDFDKCGKTDGTCQQYQERFNASVKEAHKLLNSLDPHSDHAKALRKALTAIGSLSDKNGVKVGFGPTTLGGLAEADGMHITIDYKAIDRVMDQRALALHAPDADVEDAAQDIHEGTHVAQHESGRGGGFTYDETEAYTAQSYASEAGH